MRFLLALLFVSLLPRAFAGVTQTSVSSVVPACCSVSYAYAEFGDIHYPAGFTHFEYVNPDAPKGGSISLVSPSRQSQFDKYNPFTLKGTAAPGLDGLVFESLLTGTMDEPTTAYGLLAESIEVAPDFRTVTFTLNPKARFQNGKPVLASDVKYSIEQLMGPDAEPGIRMVLADIAKVEVLSDRKVRIQFHHGGREMPLIVGGLPIFSPDWGKGKRFKDIVTDLPIASGPYRIGRVNFGKDITYVRDPHYWAKDLPVRRGMFNFGEITFKIYKDTTAQLEAFKAGEFDFIQAFVAREWAKSYQGTAFDRGEIVKREFPHHNAGDFQGFLFNTRRPIFQDVRVRKALGLALDFEWMNQQLFFNAYTRVQGYFVGSRFEAKGLPDANELALLEPWKKELPSEVFTEPVPLAPSTTPPSSFRANLKEAQELLRQAGYTYRDGALRDAQGKPFVFEIDDSSASMTRIITPFIQALARLGIEVKYHAMDEALLKQRVDDFDFDMISYRLLGSEAPGAELLDRFSSAAAKTRGSGNVIGLQSPVVDDLLAHVVKAKTALELQTALRALDRVLRHGYYMIPHWYSSVHRVAYRAAHLRYPAHLPLYYSPDGWMLSTWWYQP